MKLSKSWKIFLWILGTAILATLPAVIVYYATKQPPCPPTFQKINLEDQEIEYLADVVDAAKITEDEANQIKPGLKEAIINHMGTLNLTENLDYQITNLDAIQSGVKLTDAYRQIEVEALPTSEKATGSAKRKFQIREDMTNRSTEDVLIIEDQKEELHDQYYVDITLTSIKADVDQVLNLGQLNTIGIDYDISGLELFKVGAKFEDYKDQMWVVPNESSTHLKGQFKINFI